ncbi:exodeoxyribonuclease VII small subunit [Aliikangiella sp. G2MR2-5]|uniref:exodeoxyribonuclease VII small subunit n=1 Tax=Aliikangiella sp. G2MR2-5 TaxID=2788943 RepID=UPI0018AA33B5|nr:exodeoxyribonuclease VII small subunit [Aliikangiella sp. G2MR2-5]
MATKKVTFEEQLSQLEAIVDSLEQGELSLEESLTRFEQGVKLTRECQKALDQAQQKVQILSQDNELLQDFREDAE